MAGHIPLRCGPRRGMLSSMVESDQLREPDVVNGDEGISALSNAVIARLGAHRIIRRVLLVLCMGAVASGHETDQFSVPVGREFADLRVHFSTQFFDALGDVRDKLNARIRRSLRDGQPTSSTAHLQSPETVAGAVLGEFPTAILYVVSLELELRMPALRDRYPGLIVAHLPAVGIYDHWTLLLDLTKLSRLGRSSTIMIDGTYLGTDKIVHFVHMGYLYHSTYRAARRAGASENQATQKAVSLGAGANPLLSENTFLGLLATGVRSNADLAANYAGLQFYRNLTEAVRIEGSIRPPMLVRDGEFWRLNDHVVPHSDFFTVFVSDHWDEALNPNTYGLGITGIVGERLRERCREVIAWYRDERRRVRTQHGFALLADQLSTFYGEDYGYTGEPDRMASIANCCFNDDDSQDLRPTATIASTGQTDGATKDSLERSPLWWAARDGRLSDVRTLLDSHPDVNAQDVDGETALHCAARWGHTLVAEILLDQGANPDAQNVYGITPLHLAVRGARHDVVAALLSDGADASIRDEFGCTPLHDAASRGDERSVKLLLAAGSDPNVQDIHGSTPLHHSARKGQRAAASLLVAHGAAPYYRNTFGRLPIEEAESADDSRLAEFLAASLNARVRRSGPREGDRPGETIEGLKIVRRSKPVVRK